MRGRFLVDVLLGLVANGVRARRRRAARTRTCCSGAGCSSRNRARTASARCCLRIGRNLSFFFISVEPRVDPALQRDVSLLDADPVRDRQEHVVRELRGAIGGRDPTSTVSSHIRASARPWLNASSAFVKLSVDDHLRVREAVLHPAVVDRAARRRDLASPDVGERLHRRRRSSRAGGPWPCSRRARSRSACRGRRCR